MASELRRRRARLAERNGRGKTGKEKDGREEFIAK
jgi:hypothetical protein